MSKSLRTLLQPTGGSHFGTRYKATAVNIPADVQKDFSDPELATAKPYDTIPGEKAFPLIGTSWTFLPFIGKYSSQRRHHAAKKKYLQYGKIVRDDISPFFKILHLYDVQDFEKLFRHEGRYPFRIPLYTLKEYRKERRDLYSNGGLLVEQGTKWHDMRSKSQKHMLRPASVQYYLPGMDDTSRELVQRIEDLIDRNGEVPEFLNELYKWALESVALVALDTKFGCLKKETTKDSENWKMITAVNGIFTLMNKLEFSAFYLWKRFPTPSKRKFFEIMDFFSSTAEKYMNQALTVLKNSPDENRVSTFLENLLLKEKMDMGHTTAMITDMIVAGIDTTSHSSAFALYYLAKNQDSQQKLYEEICRVLSDPKSPITVPVLNECRYLKAAIKESMRLNPVLSGVLRVLDEDIVLSGYRVPAGVTIICENYVACSMEENFPEPTKFKPERWLRGVNEDKFNPFVFLPFGFGPRSCIGKRIAEQEMWTLLIRVIQKYRLEYHYEDIDAYSRFVNVPDKPLKLKFIPR